MTVYFFYGDEDYNIEKAVEEKKKNLDKNFAAMNFKVYDNPKFPDLIAILRSQPMMFGKLLIVINCRDYFTKTFEDKELKEIENALSNNAENLDIIFTAKFPRNEGKGPDARKKIFKMLSKYNAQQFPTFKTYNTKEIGNWITQQAKKKDLTVQPEAINTLIEQIGNNLREFDMELDKLKLFAYPQKTVTKEMVKEICISNEDLFNFAEMVMKNEKDKAIIEFRKLLDKKHPLEILSATQTMLRKWILIKLNSEKSPSEIARLTGLHEFVVKMNIQKMKNHSLKDMVKLKQNLTSVEFKLKSGATADSEGEVENAIMQ